MAMFSGTLFAMRCAALALIAVSGAAMAQPVILPVPRAVIYPGDIIRQEMLTGQPMRPGALVGSQFVTSADALIGKMARRTLLPGRPILSTTIREPYSIRQGQACLAVYQSSGLTITGQVVALEAGSVGETISARNPDSGLSIRGIVQPDGTLRVDLQ